MKMIRSEFLSYVKTVKLHKQEFLCWEAMLLRARPVLEPSCFRESRRSWEARQYKNMPNLIPTFPLESNVDLAFVCDVCFLFPWHYCLRFLPTCKSYLESDSAFIVQAGQSRLFASLKKPSFFQNRVIDFSLVIFKMDLKMSTI